MQYDNSDSTSPDTLNRLLISRSRYGVFAYLPFWFIFSMWSGDFQTLSIFFTTNTIVLLLTAVVGYTLVSKKYRLSSSNRKLLVGTILFRSLHWGLISAYMLHNGIGHHGLTTALLIILMIFASGGIALLSFNSVLGLCHALLMIIPTLILSIMNPELLDAKFIILATLAFILLICMNKAMNQDHLSDFRQRQELHLLASSMENLSKIDYLTQTYNRYGFTLEFESMWRTHLKAQSPLCLLFIAVDQLSNIRNNTSYQATEACLKRVAALLKKEIKPSYALGLYGIEEFMIALPESNLDQGVAFSARLNKAFEALTLECDRDETPPLITTSIGISSTTPKTSIKPEMLLSKAEEALSDAKSQGGNSYYATEL